MKLRSLGVGILIVFVTGCGSNIQYLPVDLTDQLIPITYEQIPSDKELECVSDSTYDKVEWLVDHILTLEGIIKSTATPNLH